MDFNNNQLGNWGGVREFILDCVSFGVSKKEWDELTAAIGYCEGVSKRIFKKRFLDEISQRDSQIKERKMSRKTKNYKSTLRISSPEFAPQ